MCIRYPKILKNDLSGKLLIKVPFDPKDANNNQVVFVCGQDACGTLGVIINQPLEIKNIYTILNELQITTYIDNLKIDVLYGGDKKNHDFFILHSNDYENAYTIKITPQIYVTISIEIIFAISKGMGPSQSLIMIGHTTWTPFELEQQIHNNEWIIIDPSFDLLFNTPQENIWLKSIGSVGIHPDIFTYYSGHA